MDADTRYPSVEPRKIINMKTNIATTKEQSARLLQCGVSTDMADMSWFRGWGNVGDYYLNLKPYNMLMRINVESCRGQNEVAPAWSLSALLRLLPKEIYDECGDSYFFSLAKEFPLSKEYGAAYIPCWDKGDAIVRKRDNDPIEACVQLIEWLTENNYKLNEQ